MASNEPCALHDLRNCADCAPRKPAATGSGLGRWFEARYPGDCDGPCGSRFSQGDLIRSDGEGGWLCQDCGQAAARA